LKSSEAKSELFEKKKIFKNLFTGDLDINCTNSKEVFLRHHLTPFQTTLYHDARKIKVDFNYRFLWVKSGQIFLRENEKTKIYKIQNQSDIFRLINLHNNEEKQ
jgi:hypothetical protein